MKTSYQELLKRPGFRYLIIGGSVYLLELLVIVVAQKLGYSPVVAVGLSFWIGLSISFFLQKLVAFDDRRMHHKILLPQIFAYSLLVLFNFGFTILVANLLQSQLPAVATRSLALATTTIWNFYLYRTKIFKSGDSLVY